MTRTRRTPSQRYRGGEADRGPLASGRRVPRVGALLAAGVLAGCGARSGLLEGVPMIDAGPAAGGAAAAGGSGGGTAGSAGFAGASGTAGTGGTAGAAGSDAGSPTVRVTRVAAGDGYTCALLETGAVACWGQNKYGELGNGTLADSSVPVIVPGLAGVTDLDASVAFTCAVWSGNVSCWGFGTDFTANPTPVPVQGLAGATRVATGEQFACALVSGEVRCWGWGAYGNLGNGMWKSSEMPVTVPGVTDAVAVAAERLHVCALRKDGSVQCWGFNGWGELGDGTQQQRDAPVPVTGVSGVVDIAAGFDSTCAVEGDGALWCWGRNDTGQTGDGNWIPYPNPYEYPDSMRLTPTSVGVPDASAVTTSYDHGCALLVDGTARCWGDNSDGQIGAGTTSVQPSLPTPVHGLASVVQISAGRGHTCAVRNDGSAWCWGDNGGGQLGDGTTKNRSTPTRVKGL